MCLTLIIFTACLFSPHFTSLHLTSPHFISQSRRVYSDTSRADKNAALAAAKKKKLLSSPKKAANKSNFTEAMANAYQVRTVQGLCCVLLSGG